MIDCMQDGRLLELDDRSIVEWKSEVEAEQAKLKVAALEDIDLSNKEWAVMVYCLLKHHASSLKRLNLR